MAKTFQMTSVGRRKLKLSNLSKVLYPGIQLLKAEVIQYYLNIAPIILNHIKRRPMSTIRFPDGINGMKFFQKDKPKYAPEWIESVALGSDGKKNYILPTEEAILVWLANLACLELHNTQVRHPNFALPDYFVFDLDPPNEKFPFTTTRDLAVELRDLLLNYGYHPFVKTSGGKGAHVLVPILPKWDFDTVFAAAKKIADEFVKKQKEHCTLNIKKDARGGKLLVDIYRNRSSQTIISAYSLRARPGAPVSMPLSWKDFENTTASLDWNVRNVIEKVNTEGDAWEGFSSYAADLHTQKKKTVKSKKLAKSTKHKTPAQLKAYQEKRDFNKTPEPQPGLKVDQESVFVVHRHHASRLHYDLRLEQDGSLRSWAIPKGLPQKPGIKRLAVETEPHPIEYLDFEGEIPKGEYGGGTMWVFARGRYTITKQKKTGFYFHLSSPQLNGEYRMHLIKNKEWLLEKVDRPQYNLTEVQLVPMLAIKQDKLPAGTDWQYEIKWDGIRTLIALDEGELIIRSRSGRDITSQFPELQDAAKSFRSSSFIIDAEIVCLDNDGRPDFKRVISRLHSANPAKIQRLVKTNPAYCYVFDCLYLDGRSTLNEPLVRRQEWIYDSIKKGNSYRVSEAIDDGEALYKAAKSMDLEGIMAKRKTGKYYIGKRSDDWLKLKFRNTADCVIVGYTLGNGEREIYFGALHLAQVENEGLRYVGKVGTGFDMAKLKIIAEQLSELKKIRKPIKEKTDDDRVSTWIEPKLFVEIEYASITGSGTFREPVFLRMRPDL